MKKLIAVLLSLMLFASFAFAEEAPETEESPYLTGEEVEIYLNGLGKAALSDPDLGVIAGQDGPATAVFAGGTLQIADEAMEENTAVVGALLSPEQKDLRGIEIGDEMEKVLSAYPCHNPNLAGSYYDAALYVSGEKPQVTLGYILRDGQRVTSVFHQAYLWTADGVTLSQVKYQLDGGVVTAIEIQALDRMLTEEEAGQRIQDVSEMQENGEYFLYPQDETGMQDVFGREDLSLLFNAEKRLDFLDLTAEDMQEALGEPASDEWTEDSTGEYLRKLSWPGVELVLQYNEARAFQGVDSLNVTGGQTEGPRGVRVGDTLDSVINRFHHELKQTGEFSTSLYGDGQTAPFGVLNYSSEGAEVIYSFSLEEESEVIWHMEFALGELQSMNLLLR